MQSISLFLDITKVTDFQQNWRGVSRDLYIYWTFFRYVITVPILIIVGYVWQKVGGGRWPFCPNPPPRVAPKRPIPNRFNKSSHLKVFCRKGVLRNFAKFTWKHLCQSLFLNKVAGLRPGGCFWVKCVMMDFFYFRVTSSLKKKIKSKVYNWIDLLWIHYLIT